LDIQLLLLLLLLLLLKIQIYPALSELQGQVTKSVETVQDNTEGNGVIDYMID